LIAGLLVVVLSYSVIDYMYNSVSEYTNHSVDDRLRTLVEEFKSAIAKIVFLIMLALAIIIVSVFLLSPLPLRGLDPDL